MLFRPDHLPWSFRSMLKAPIDASMAATVVWRTDQVTVLVSPRS
ncbi:hypothetical protein SLEP1_g15299 [Rubroshorea leprosula]|uniref:Uncharacterized protein n=1 Tax=Rubroshorea leprosula TaxID=152421 RepID=A0AAV5IW01_9ROSI|nr:hypothetical protein SLEP1_g15299 [Rubroshorea leprosula]